MTKNVSIQMMMFLSLFMFSCWHQANFNQVSQIAGVWVPLRFEGFFSFINITHPIPKERTMITIGSGSLEDFIRVTVFSFMGFSMNVQMFEDLEF